MLTLTFFVVDNEL